MTETESKTDPWKVAKSTIRARIADYSVALLGHSSGSQQAKENAQTAIDVAIDAARAAEAAQHRQEIARWRKTITYITNNIATTATPEECEQRGREIDAIDEDYEMACRTNQALSARLAAVEAERDSARDACLEWDAICKGVRAEQNRLKAALQGVMPFIATQAMACGGMKCREMWCESCFGEDEAREFAQAGAAAMGEARAALTPQGQSTDGETR